MKAPPSLVTSLALRLSFAPRFALPAAILAALVNTSCVPAMRYEEANSAAQVEGEAKRRLAAELARTQEKVAALQAELRAHEDGLATREEKLAEETLAKGALAKERDESTTLVEELRAQLTRANERLSAYRSEVERLERELNDARAHAGETAAANGPGAPPTPPPISAAESARLTPAPSSSNGTSGFEEPSRPEPALLREVKTLLARAHLQDRVQARSQDGKVALRVPADLLFDRDSASLRSGFPLWLEAATTFAAARPALSLRLREIEPDPSLPKNLGRDRREQLTRALGARNLLSRLNWERPKEKDSATPRGYELWLVEKGT
ncbi:MAG TPA: hypothetical protein VFQ35_20205 [Polyangiaceae bacterium]|nr:hypothetical protein [Polyangiaceae bacterium]